ncbi:hypothetical protein MG599_24035 (plasmid) [Paenarthrobacter sp. SD-1]|uniref:TrbL/VirB6 plasmid conjugal transfer protein n=1 Tax=Paenarthrobacter ureafaciens TaxID=37931 RepID=A0AAX3EQA7_PAEUR|nr:MULTISPECIES: hypothetical protein [Paenarthrobacter]MDO5878341.1 hypothetical protein [Paenarthrobacter sp. SD-1]UYW00220.1 hypothetical protein NL394_23980 [Paenarthrobacter ureafaciens]
MLRRITTTVTKRQRKAFIFAFLAFMMLGGAIAHAADGPTTPVGFGDMFPIPDYTNGGPKTLFENYGQGAWFIDTELSWQDVLQNAGNGLVNGMFFILNSVMYAAISLVYWLTSLTKIDTIGDAMSGMVGASAAGLMSWLFPSALAFGAVVAYSQRARDGKGAGLGQLAWLVVAGVLGVSLAVSPATWTRGIDDFRTLGADAVTASTGNAVTVNEDYPLAWPKVTYTQDVRETSLRKTSDGIWRSLNVAPWCMVNYGSIEACQRYGISMLNLGADSEARKDYIKNTIYQQEASPGQDGKNSPTGQWVKGERWPERLGMATLFLIVGLLFAILIIVLAISAIAALVVSYLLLAVGAWFAMLWVIPGRPRQWGVSWFEALIGSIIISLVNLLLFQGVILMITAVMGNVSALGWGQSTVLALLVTSVAFGLRSQLEQLFSAARPGFAGSAFMGYMAMKGLGKATRAGGQAVGGLLNGVRRAGKHYGSSLRGGGMANGPARSGGRLTDLGERSTATRRAQFRQLQGSIAKPHARAAELPTGTAGPSSTRALPAPTTGAPAGSPMRGPKINNAAFAMGKGSTGAYAMPTKTPSQPGRRAESIRPIQERGIAVRTAPTARTATAAKPVAHRVDLPESPRKPAAAPRPQQRQRQFRQYAGTGPVIKGEVIKNEPAPRPRRPQRRTNR